MEQVFSQPPIKRDDAEVLQDHSRFLRGRSSEMEGIHYLDEFDITDRVE